MRAESEEDASGRSRRAAFETIKRRATWAFWIAFLGLCLNAALWRLDSRPRGLEAFLGVFCVLTMILSMLTVLGVIAVRGAVAFKENGWRIDLRSLLMAMTLIAVILSGLRLLVRGLP